MKKMYLQYKADVAKMEELTELAILRSYNRQHSVHDVEKFGGGWTGDEALAIALYCSLPFLDNFEEAMIAAVNHAGDTDSTGAITGNILGAALGYEAIPQFYKDDLESHDLILHMADDLYRGEITKMEMNN
jgi:ADP-ribosylglycohydrolase